ncbi:hypothetical protein DSM107007_44690 [Nostoc sp. PCC 7120 = FACHB-418]|uniref:Uncharacterized protein n=1 Tax=Trichormus variabilis NIES-23 TaxID=1973479 RepID=A0A1Z4KF46_ANAVA|nr:hypothetical protein DSM107007_44690 [Nostoc sp. PCC 7120 = FACHB-418]BAY67537.1 hypothetical protein NIES23_03110 [Trichormus variabilis NIES-23]
MTPEIYCDYKVKLDNLFNQGEFSQRKCLCEGCKIFLQKFLFELTEEPFGW